MHSSASEAQGMKFNLNSSKIQNPPSIPSHENVYGYEQDHRGNLIRQKNTEQVTTGIKDDMVGPGSYNIHASDQVVAKTTKAPSWKLPVEKSLK